MPCWKFRLRMASRSISKRLGAHMASLQREWTHTDMDLAQAIHSGPVWREKDDRLCSVPGVGRYIHHHCAGKCTEIGYFDEQADSSNRLSESLNELRKV